MLARGFVRERFSMVTTGYPTAKKLGMCIGAIRVIGLRIEIARSARVASEAARDDRRREDPGRRSARIDA